MMLLTSGQVSVAISSTIGLCVTSAFLSAHANLDSVFLFTTALFLSGYVLQQATVRDLRAAIRPQLDRLKPGPDLYLPPQFTEDGYLIDVIKTETQTAHDDAVRDTTIIEDAGSTIEEESRQSIEERSSDMVGATQKAARRKVEESGLEMGQEAQNPIVDSKPRDTPKETLPIASKPREKPISAAERRRRIREQIVAEGEGEGFKGYRRRMW